MQPIQTTIHSFTHHVRAALSAISHFASDWPEMYEQAQREMMRAQVQEIPVERSGIIPVSNRHVRRT